MNNLKTALICIAKMENAYIRDFVEYYHHLGITHIFLFDNNDIDGEQFTDVIDDYIREGYVDVINIRGATSMFSAYNHEYSLQGTVYTFCYLTMCKSYDWVMALDIDEFLTFTDDNMTIDKYLSQDHFSDVNEIWINWMCYGDSGKIYPEPGVAVYDYLTEPIKDGHSTWNDPATGRLDNQNIKLILRTNLPIEYESPHIVKYPDNYDFTVAIATGEHVIGCEKYLNYSERIDFSCAYIRHYVTKTISEWMQFKMQRGYPSYNNYYVAVYPGAFFRHGNQWTIEKQEFIDKFMYENYVKKDGTKN